MKLRELFVVGFLIIGQFTNAQSAYGEDSIMCEQKHSEWYEFYKAKNYTDAYTPMKWVLDNCAASKVQVYIVGPRIVKAVLDIAPDSRKQGLIDTLFILYDWRMNYFPSDDYETAKILASKGNDMISLRKDQYAEANAILKQSIGILGKESSANTLFNFAKTSAQLYNDKVVTKAEIIDIYQDVSQIISDNLTDEDQENDQYYEQAQKGIDNMFGPIINCEDLIPFFTGVYSDLVANTFRLQRAALLLERKECTSNDLYFQMAQDLYKLNPDVESAIRIGNMAYLRNDFGKAIELYKQAAGMDDDATRRGETHLKIAQCYVEQGSRESARTWALKAAADKPKWGDPFLLIGDLYAQTKGCGTNEFEVKTVFWAAIDKYEYAMSIDPSVAEKAQKRISTYRSFAPDKTLTFTYGKLDAGTVDVGCWINEKAKIRVE
jgi:tetratricopeptide (TPR) repeat protein